MNKAPRLLQLVYVPIQKLVDVGAYAIEESPNKYPELYEDLKNKVGENVEEFICVTWLRSNEWHGQPDGFYHRARFVPAILGEPQFLVNEPN